MAAVRSLVAVRSVACNFAVAVRHSLVVDTAEDMVVGHIDLVDMVPVGREFAADMVDLVAGNTAELDVVDLDRDTVAIVFDRLIDQETEMIVESVPPYCGIC